jgi:methyl-accepting chemotaxis protein
MMKNLLNLRLSYIIASVALLPILAVVGFSIFLVAKEANILTSVNSVEKLTDLSVTMSNLVHEMQKERGATAVFVGSSGQKFNEELATQRIETDQKLDALNHFLADFDEASYGSAFLARFNGIIKTLDELTAVRAKISSLSIPKADAIGYYTGSNGAVLDLVTSLAELSPDPTLSNQLVAYSSFLKGKERAGIERAVGAGGFTAGVFTVPALEKFAKLIAEQNVYNNTFLSYATQDQRGRFDALMSGEAAQDVDRMRDIAKSGGLAGALQGLEGATWFGRISAKINGLKEIEDSLASDLGIQMGQISRAALLGLSLSAAFAFGAIICSIAASFLIARALTGMVGEIVIVMNDLSEGNLEIELPEKRENEIGEMVKAITVFQSNGVERARLEQEQAEAARLSEAESDRLRGVADQLENVLSESMTGIEASVTDLKETGSMLEKAAASGHECSSSATDASSQAASNVQTVATAAEEMGASINEITTQTTRSQVISGQALEMSEQAASNMSVLETKASSVGDIVQLINDIAAQTNLLALNATIEAARAGDAGKGFAVVASEVKSLATQTASATEEITSQISSLQDASTTVSETVTNIGSIVREVSENITSISAAMEEQSAATQEVARSAQEASQRTSEVDTNVAQVAVAAEQTGTASDGVVRSSNDLSGQAESLKTSVSGLLKELRAS